MCFPAVAAQLSCFAPLLSAFSITSYYLLGTYVTLMHRNTDGGGLCSQFLHTRFHYELAAHPLIGSNPALALHETWPLMDAKFYEFCMKRWEADCSSGGVSPTSLPDPNADPTEGVVFPRDGSTATVCVVVGNQAYITNCGDSAAAVVRRKVKGSGGSDRSLRVLSSAKASGDAATAAAGTAAATSAAASATVKSGGGTAVQLLTEDHGTNNKSEAARLRSAGGELREAVFRVAAFPFCCLPWKALRSKPRAYPGGLLVTRAFGNFHAKVGTVALVFFDRLCCAVRVYCTVGIVSCNCRASQKHKAAVLVSLFVLLLPSSAISLSLLRLQ
jgi:Protein phosphatase 2C